MLVDSKVQHVWFSCWWKKVDKPKPIGEPLFLSKTTLS
jgi:hypothetical protein